MVVSFNTLFLSLQLLKFVVLQVYLVVRFFFGVLYSPNCKEASALVGRVVASIDAVLAEGGALKLRLKLAK
jgi:hypothetical protein